MGIKIIKSAALAAFVLIAGCDRHDPNICSTAPQLDPSGSTIGSWANADGCIHRWAYRLAPGPENATLTAEAAVGACYDAIEKWTQKVLGYDDNLPPYREPVTGRMMDYRANMYQEARSYALFYVVQARAGKCKIP